MSETWQRVVEPHAVLWPGRAGLVARPAPLVFLPASVSVDIGGAVGRQPSLVSRQWWLRVWNQTGHSEPERVLKDHQVSHGPGSPRSRPAMTTQPCPAQTLYVASTTQQRGRPVPAVG